MLITAIRDVAHDPIRPEDASQMHACDVRDEHRAEPNTLLLYRKESTATLEMHENAADSQHPARHSLPHVVS